MFCLYLFCIAILCVISSFAKERACCFSLIVFLVSCDCYRSLTLPHGVVCWSAVCDCGIF